MLHAFANKIQPSCSIHLHTKSNLYAPCICIQNPTFMLHAFTYKIQPSCSMHLHTKSNIHAPCICIQNPTFMLHAFAYKIQPSCSMHLHIKSNLHAPCICIQNPTFLLHAFAYEIQPSCLMHLHIRSNLLAPHCRSDFPDTIFDRHCGILLNRYIETAPSTLWARGSGVLRVIVSCAYHTLYFRSIHRKLESNPIPHPFTDELIEAFSIVGSMGSEPMCCDGNRPRRIFCHHYTAKNTRRFYGKITGNQLQVHFPLFFTDARKSFSGTRHSTVAKRHVLLLVM